MSLKDARWNLIDARYDFCLQKDIIAECNAWIAVHGRGSLAAENWELMRKKAFGEMNKARGRLIRAIKDVRGLLYAGN